MSILGVLVLLVAAAAATSDVPKDDDILYRCVLNVDRTLYLKERKYPFYICDSDGGEHFLFAAENFSDAYIETRVDRKTVQHLNQLASNLLRPKRQFGFGGSSSGAQASSTSFGGGFGGGFPGGFGGGYPGNNFGAGFSGSYSQANSFANGGGVGYGK
ncbi:hypothetical protein J6590_011510 [Homalodisca vitripennis]|nr:hypothetical protein J6590_011510 [Homalodisca vitripennis]